ncbi:hypothetical protein J437_LFUL000937 [Ladona fulva]|uniref:Integrase catalytic domain-containing protein n=1 Tax=Ladona fulva TaxID=123851 RepID=A0A8K0P0Y6_LADFU|nr:hypothetical protein J437_LFUL000937 [Ladona fulva]
MNAIVHHLTPPYHSSSNGLTDRMVQTVKHLLAKLPDKDWEVELNNVLLTLHTTPRVATGAPPSVFS